MFFKIQNKQNVPESVEKPLLADLWQLINETIINYLLMTIDKYFRKRHILCGELTTNPGEALLKPKQAVEISILVAVLKK